MFTRLPYMIAEGELIDPFPEMLRTPIMVKLI